MREVPYPTPGEILLHEFLLPMQLSVENLANRCALPVAQLQAIIDGEERVTFEVSTAISAYFGIAPDFWLGLQSDSARASD